VSGGVGFSSFTPRARARGSRCLAIGAVEENHYGESDSLFAAEAQQIEHEHDDEHEHDSPKLRGLGLIIII
jgi:hypothetical protein